MTDRISGYTVVLEHEVRDDDARPILDALRMVKGVLSVQAVVGAVDVQIAQARERIDLQRKLYAFIEGLQKP